MDAAGPVAQRFPLVARYRPACVRLVERVGGLTQLADTARRDCDPVAASAVFNQAALLASDCAMPDLARDWCHRHASIHLRARPLTAGRARQGLEPLVNLARLHIRDGDGDAAHQLLTTLYGAVGTRADIAIDGHALPASELAASPDEHRGVVQWLWTVLLADGTRALTSAGRWGDAHAHLQQHKGVGGRMLDGRQVAVIHHTLSGNTDAALALLADTTPGEPTEDAVTACLTVLCRPDRLRHEVDAMIDRYEQLDPDRRLTVFTLRLGLTVIDAAGAGTDPRTARIAAGLAQLVVDAGDGYAARELLAYNLKTPLPVDIPADVLSELVTDCGLDTRTTPSDLHDQLLAALDVSEAVLTDVLAPA